jgi:PIN domain nuclease of toxin-antitoxin system
VLLLDTHAAIWFATEDESLGRRLRKCRPRPEK